MKQIKPHVNSYCTYCQAAGVEKVRANWRASGLTGNSTRACDNHRPQLRKMENARLERHDDMSEADYQTWGRL